MYVYLQGWRGPVPMTDLSPLWKAFSWLLPGICKGCCCVHCCMTISQCAFEGKVCTFTLQQLKRAVNPLHTHSPEHPFFKLSKPILQPLLVHWVHQPLNSLMPLSWLYSSVSLSLLCWEPKNKTQHSRCGLTSAKLRGNYWGHAWWILCRREGHVPKESLDEYRK